MPGFAVDGHRLWYSERGDPAGPPVVLVHGLFFSRRMYERLAARLPDHRVLLLDLRGHGKSTRPRHPEDYRWNGLADDVLALLDHLGIGNAVIGGLSLGANVSLVFALRHPERVRGLIVEMPVLDNSRAAAYFVFKPLRFALWSGRHALAPATRALRRLPIPGTWPEAATARDLFGLHPVAGAALLDGLLTDDDPPHDPATLGTITVPMLVIGHHLDGLHAMDDAVHVARNVPGARLVRVATIADLRLRAGRYAGIVGDFLTEHDL